MAWTDDLGNYARERADTLYPSSNPGMNSSAQDMAFNPRSTENWVDELYKKYQSGDVSAGEKLFEYYATMDKEKENRSYNAKREDTAYQRLVQDLRKAGISPYIISGATPFAGSAQISSVSGSQMTSAANARKTQESNAKDRSADILIKIIGLIGTVLAAAILA